MTINLLFCGELDIHACSLLPFLKRHGYDITIINTSHHMFPPKVPGTDISCYNLYEKTKIRLLFRGRLELFRKSILYNLTKTNSKLASKIWEINKQNGLDLIYGSWGSQSLPEIGLLQRRFDIPVVYEFLTYPVNVNKLLVKVENFLNGKIITSLSGRILASNLMLNYIERNFAPLGGKNYIFQERYSKNFFYKKRLPLLSNIDSEPHLIFIGLDVSDVMSQIIQIAKRRIHIHICEQKRPLPNFKYRNFIHTFKKFPYSKLVDGTFATFMTQFDACLVTYNFRKASALDRFYNSIPNRFSLALTAGIPVIMPANILKTCEEIIRKDNIGFTYKNYDDLLLKLKRNDLMDSLKRNCITKSEAFTLENNYKELDAFLRNIINRP